MKWIQPISADFPGLPRQDHVWIATEQLVCFHKNEFNEILYKLDSMNMHVRSNQT